MRGFSAQSSFLPVPSELRLAIIGTMRLRYFVLLSCLLCACSNFDPLLDPDRVHVVLDTELGEIEMVLHPKRAPITSANFLLYVDEGLYDQGRFHRAVTLDNQPDKKVRIQVVQAGINPRRRLEGFPAITLERTTRTGLRHHDGSVSMARSGPNSARSDFFICIGKQPSLDFGGARNPDGQGFAAFGSVIRGMDVVRAIQAAPKERQNLQPAITIKSARRKTPQEAEDAKR